MGRRSSLCLYSSTYIRAVLILALASHTDADASTSGRHPDVHCGNQDDVFFCISGPPPKSPESTASFLDANGRPKHVVCPKGCVHEYRSARALRTLAALQKDTSTPSKRGAQLHATFAHTVGIQMDLVMFFGGQATVFSTLER